MNRSRGNFQPGKLIADVVLYAALLLLALTVAVPLVYLVISAFKTEAGFLDSLFLPKGDGLFGVDWGGLTLVQFKRLFSGDVGIGRAVLNSLVLSTATALLATACCSAAGYALAMFDFRGRRIADWLVIAALVIPPPLLLAPGYQWLFDLGLLNSYWGVILPAAAPAFGVFLFRQAAKQSVSKSTLEAARIDGAGEATIFLGVALPMLRPMVGAFVMITFLGMWNNFIGPQIVLQTESKQPLAIVIFEAKTAYYTDYGLLMAGTLVSVLPVVALFVLLQREFIAGLSSGAIKG